MAMTEDLKTLIPKLAHRRVLVIGDVILDEYVIGRATRMSREAPIPVLEFQERRFIPGGAANPAANIVALGSEAVQVGIIGKDSAADNLRHTLQERGILTTALVACDERPTTVKTRILAQMGLRFPQQVARVDTLSRIPITRDVEDSLLAHIMQQIDSADAVLFSDYHVGMLTGGLIDRIRQVCAEKQILLASDAQGKLEKYEGFHLVKCNADDAADYLRRELRSDADFEQAAAGLYAKMALTGAMVITRGAEGATVATAEGQYKCPSPKVSDVYDTVGAGDTTIAVMTLARVGGASFTDAVMLANYASGIVVRHVGNYAPTPDELAQALAD